jgi:hypothetical protein
LTDAPFLDTITHMENDEIITTLRLSAAVYALDLIYETASWRTNIADLQTMGRIYLHLSRINPNDWYLTDEETDLVKSVGRILTQNGVIG